MWNVIDKRLVRIDFGPTTQPLVITEYGVFLFVRSSREPWLEFDELRELFSDGSSAQVPHDPDGYSRMVELTESLQEKGFLVPASPEVADLIKKYSRKGEGAIH